MLHSTIQQIFRSRRHLGWGAVAAKVAFVIKILDLSSTQILKFWNFDYERLNLNLAFLILRYIFHTNHFLKTFFLSKREV